jgi:hypothetical protein
MQQKKKDSKNYEKVKLARGVKAKTKQMDVKQVVYVYPSAPYRL